MLHQNDSFNRQYPIRWMGGAGVGLGASSKLAFQNPEKYRNRFGGTNRMSQYAGLPVGYRGQFALIQPTKSGGLGATGPAVLGVGVVSNANLAGGMNKTATPVGAGAVTSAGANALAWMVSTGNLKGQGALVSGITGAIWLVSSPAGHGSLTSALNALAAIASSGHLTGSGSISAANLAAAMRLTASPVGTGLIVAPLAGPGWLHASPGGLGHLVSVNLAGGRSLTSTFAGVGALVASIKPLTNIGATLHGLGVITLAQLGSAVNMVVALAGSGVITADVKAMARLSTSMHGIGATSPGIVGAIRIAAALSGHGAITPHVMGLATLTQAFSGIGTLTTSIRARAELAAAMAGLSHIQAGDAGGMRIAAMLAGAGALVDADLRGEARLGCAINIGAKPSVADIAAAVWSTLAAQYPGLLTMGGKLNAASSAGDPWGTILPDGYPVGSAGYIIGQEIKDNAETAAVAAMNAEIAAIDATAQATLARQARTNREELTEALVDNYTLFADDGVTPLQINTVTDKNGGPITIPVGAPARRSGP